jgi:uncharacterized protein (DUF488 family)
MIKLFTIGFAGKTAERFFKLLTENGVTKIIDTRLHPTSQLSGFAKARDLQFFASRIGGIGYQHILDFAPTEELLARIRKKEINWEQYEAEYLELMVKRKVIDKIDPNLLHESCLLCSEHDPQRCHRRILSQHLADHFHEISVTHLM